MSQYSTQTFGPIFSDIVLAELDNRFSRKSIKLAAHDKPLAMGTVLMKNTDGPYSALNSEGTATAILLADKPASTTPQYAVIIRGYAIINAANLVFDSAVSDKQAALNQLVQSGTAFIIENLTEGDA